MGFFCNGWRSDNDPVSLAISVAVPNSESPVRSSERRADERSLIRRHRKGGCAEPVNGAEPAHGDDIYLMHERLAAVDNF